MIPADKLQVPSQGTAYDALKLMEEQHMGMLPVVVKGKIKGVVHRRRIEHVLALEMKYGAR